jgi:hypothetical protein
MAAALFFIGAILGSAGGIWLIVTAFRESALWGLGVWLVPFVSLIFVVKYWDDAKRPFFLSLAGGGLMLLGAILSGPDA